MFTRKRNPRSVTPSKTVILQFPAFLLPQHVGHHVTKGAPSPKLFDLVTHRDVGHEKVRIRVTVTGHVDVFTVWDVDVHSLEMDVVSSDCSAWREKLCLFSERSEIYPPRITFVTEGGQETEARFVIVNKFG